MASTWVYLIRHGEVEHAPEGRFFGHTDVGLSVAGLAQVEALGHHLGAEPIEAVYASDLRRARQSAAPLAARRGLTTVVVPALREVAMGRWEGLTFREIRVREPEALTRWLADPVAFAFPEGESLADLRARVMPALRDVVACHAGRRVAIVAHGGANRVILGEALGMPPGNVLRLAQDYACWSLIEYGGETAILHGLNRRLAAVGGAPPVETTVGGAEA